jgi:hypothetical protein
MMAGQLVKEIADSQEFLAKRKNYDDYSDSAIALRKNLAEQMSIQIGNLQELPPKEAGMLIDALSENAYGEFTQLVSASIDSRLSSAADVIVKKSGKSTPQALTHPQKFTTQADVALFKNPKINLHVKLSVLVHRLNRLGVTHPHEKTQRWWFAFLIMLHFNDIPSPSTIYKLVLDGKEVIEAERKVYPYGHLINYPQSPLELGEQMLKYAYDSDDPPVTSEVQGLESMAKEKMIMRKNHSSLKGKADLGSPCSPSSAAASGSERALTRADVQAMLKQERDSLASLQRVKEERDAVVNLGGGVSVKVEPCSSPRTDRRADTPQRGGVHGVTWGTALARGRLDLEDDGDEKLDAAAAKVEPKAESDDASDDSVDSKAGLDKFAQAAIKALGKRDATRRREAAARKKGEVRKRPSAAIETEPDDAVKPKVMKADPKAAKAVKVEPKVAAAPKKVTKKPAAQIYTVTSKTAPMPKPLKAGQDAPPSDYRGGRIYWKLNRMAFRVIRKMPQYATEKQVRWSGDKPTKKDWLKALDAIDQYKK